MCQFLIGTVKLGTTVAYSVLAVTKVSIFHAVGSCQFLIGTVKLTNRIEANHYEELCQLVIGTVKEDFDDCQRK